MTLRALTPFQPVTAGGDRPSPELVEIVARLVDNARALRAYDAADIASASHDVNVFDKAEGVQVWDRTNGRIMVAAGSGTTSVWWRADGAVSVTPS